MEGRWRSVLSELLPRSLRASSERGMFEERLSAKVKVKKVLKYKITLCSVMFWRFSIHVPAFRMRWSFWERLMTSFKRSRLSISACSRRSRSTPICSTNVRSSLKSARNVRNRRAYRFILDPNAHRPDWVHSNECH